MNAARRNRRADACPRRLTAALCVVWSLLGAALDARAQAGAQIVNGAPELAEPTTAGLLRGDPDSGWIVCSATLVGCDSAITTAHCFNSYAAEKNHLFFQHAGFVEIESATRHPAFVAGFPPNPIDADALRVEDIAFIKLTEPVSGIAPSSIVRFGPPALGQTGRIVGFGRDPITATSAAGADDNAGLKRSGEITLAACEGSLAGEDVLCWQPPDPPDPLGAPGEDVSTCDGDSGGPLFVLEHGIRVVAGITKGAVYIPDGQSDLCEPPVDPYDTNVDRHRVWIHGATGQGGMIAVTGAIPTFVKECGPLDALPEDVQSGDVLGDCDASTWDASPAPRTCGFTGFLDVGGTASATHQFPVPSGTTGMRVAWNGVAMAPGNVDTDYYLRATTPPTTTQYDCAATGSGTVGYCEISNPTAGTWHTLVDQTLYQGEYQVTVTLFGPPVPPAVSSLDAKARVLMVAAMLGLALLALAGRLRRRPRGDSTRP